MEANTIDFVVTWVDGNDPVWQEAKSRYTPQTGSDAGSARYQDWEQLKYWFRSIEKNAPWVNKIHFVTFGHLPKWLNTQHPKLHIVNHEDFIPKEYLPVFNSTAIEIHLHRIPGLSENFVYFNDDTYLMQPCVPEDFFKTGKPVDMPVFEPIEQNHNGVIYFYHLYNDYSIYKKYFSKKAFLKSIFKYVNPKCGSVAVHNALNILNKNFYIQSLHLPKSFQKTSFERVWNDYGETLKKTAESKFRAYSNNSPELFRGYQLMTGNFYPRLIRGTILDTRRVAHVKEVLEAGNHRLLCLSDNTTNDTFEADKKEINASFEKILPEKCSYELDGE